MKRQMPPQTKCVQAVLPIHNRNLRRRYQFSYIGRQKKKSFPTKYQATSWWNNSFLFSVKHGTNHLTTSGIFWIYLCCRWRPGIGCWIGCTAYFEGSFVEERLGFRFVVSHYCYGSAHEEEIWNEDDDYFYLSVVSTAVDHSTGKYPCAVAALFQLILFCVLCSWRYGWYIIFSSRAVII